MRGLILLSLLFLYGASYAQNVLVTSTSEWTVSGIEVGGSVGFQSKKLWSFGGFFQRGIAKNSEENTQVESFAGIYGNVPIAKSERVNFFFSSRLGFVDKDFFVFVPGVETRVNITKRLGVNMGMGVRKSYPALNGKISLALF